jgi:hypothetical protein
LLKVEHVRNILAMYIFETLFFFLKEEAIIYKTFWTLF